MKTDNPGALVLSITFLLIIFICTSSDADDLEHRLLASAIHATSNSYMLLFEKELPDLSIEDFEDYVALRKERNLASKEKNLVSPKYTFSPWGYRWGGNRAFFVARGSAEAVPAELIWLTYISDFRIVMPPDQWFADITWHQGREEVYVAIVGSKGQKMNLAVYQLDPHVETNRALPTFPSKRADWPDPTEPLKPDFEHKAVQDFKAHLCGISGIELLEQVDGLLVRAERVDQDCAPIDFQLDLDSGEWTDMTTVEEEVN